MLRIAPEPGAEAMEPRCPRAQRGGAVVAAPLACKKPFLEAYKIGRNFSSS